MATHAAAVDIINRAHHRREPNELLDLLADDAEYVRYDMNNLGSPTTTSGKDEIAVMIEDVFTRDMTHEVREVVVGGTLVVLTMAGMERFDVRWVGKAGTFALMFAFPLFLASHSTLGWADTAGVLAWVFAIPGLFFSCWSAATYVPVARRALAEGRRNRQR